MVYISSGALQNTSTTPSFARDFKLAQEPRIFAERACCRAPVFSQAQQSLEGPKIYGASSKICKTITIYIYIDIDIYLENREKIFKETQVSFSKF